MSDDTQNDRPIEVYGDSPDRIEIPVWVLAQIKLDPPLTDDGKPRRTIDGLYETIVLLVGCRFGVQPDEVIRLDRKAIGRWAGVRADKTKWITDYLARIGFLEVYRGRYTAGGREPDRFRVNVRPPVGYDGPQTLAEVDLALSHPADPSRCVSPGQSQNPTGGAKGAEPKPHRRGKGSVFPGQSQNPTGGAKGAEPKPHRRGKGSVSPGQSQNPTGGVLPRARRSESDLLSEERRGDQTEPVPGGAAEPPATGRDEHDVAAAEVVASAPWADVADRLGAAVDVPQQDVAQMTARIAARLRDGSVTVDQAQLVIAAALSEAKRKPVAYAAGAFTTGQLASWRGRVNRVVLARPSTSSQQDAAEAESAAGAGESPSELPDCAACGTRAGEPLTWRQSQDGIPCRECRPEAAAKAAPADPPRD